MNHLAHLFLAGENKGLIIGNFIADMVKGKKMLDYPVDVQAGIQMHRQIDHFTDTHSVYKRSVQRARPILGKFAGMAMDVLFDYYLSNHWEAFADKPLQVFATQRIELLKQHEANFPEHSRRFLQYLIQGNVLWQYGSLPVLTRVFEGMSRRTVVRDNPLQKSIECLREHHRELEEDFLEFFPLLMAHFSTQTQSYGGKF